MRLDRLPDATGPPSISQQESYQNKSGRCDWTVFPERCPAVHLDCMAIHSYLRKVRNERLSFDSKEGLYQ